MHNSRAMGSWGLSPRFEKKKTYEVKQCVIGSDALQVSPEGPMIAAMKMKSKLPQKLYCVGDAKDMKYLPMEAEGTKYRQLKREAMCAESQGKGYSNTLELRLCHHVAWM